MALHQQQHRLAPGSLLLQRTGTVFRRTVQPAERLGQLRVVQNAGLEAGQTVAFEFQFVQYPGDAFAVRIKTAVAPALLMGLCPGVQFIGVDQHHAAHRRQVFTAAVPETLGTGLDDGDHIAFMHMRSKALLEIPGVQHLDIAKCWRLPEAGLFLRRKVHGLPFNHQRKTKKKAMLTSMLIRVLRVNNTSTTATTEPSR
ncbi:hypothetical protein D3C80_1392880 [compost metagenome]